MTDGTANGTVNGAVRRGVSALRLTVFVGEQEVWHHRPLYAEIVHRARAAGLAGASVFRGVEGFGTTSVIHTQRLLSLSEELPVAVVAVDTEDRIRGFLPELDELLAGGGLVTLDPCEMIVYRERPEPAAGGEGGRG
ncbi:DUF190 domain-containing protein [Streptomyces sp. CT34]|uniref:DUF190 domain-containing protein n=1 Tax=Streptomyces sp. CT34 TaxID=1553907 RepID=UPI0006924F23|nr:DUF190 domain-containing protein [Streptomyces sp. CT34]